jgi:uncharacterized protein (TIGR00369 family)
MSDSLKEVPSAFRELIGMRVVAMAPDRVTVEFDVLPHLLNYAGTLHGGAAASVIDMAGALAGCYSPDPTQRRVAVTLSFTTAFLGTTRQGTVRAVGIKQGGGRRIFTSTVEMFDADGRIIATGQGTYRYVSNGERAHSK